MKNRKRKIDIIKIVWLLICFGIGIVFFNTGQFTGEYAVTFIVMMTIITFPMGYLAIYFLRAMAWFVSAAFNHDMAGSYEFSVSLWVLMTVLGYFQWFYLVPKLFRAIKARKRT